MRLTEELLVEMENNKILYSDGFIKPDGEYLLIKGSHLHSLMTLLPDTEQEIWKMIPDDDSALFWLIEKTQCVITDYNSSVGMKKTPEQEEVFSALVSHHIITDKYFDISEERKKRAGI